MLHLLCVALLPRGMGGWAIAPTFREAPLAGQSRQKSTERGQPAGPQNTPGPILKAGQRVKATTDTNNNTLECSGML